MTYFDRMGMSYCVVPGISSFSAAAAALKIELTMPEVAQSVILTRGAGKTPMPAKENLQEMAKTNATMCIFLSALIAKKVQAQLMEHFAPSTPVAVVYRVGWEEEKIQTGTLTELAQLVKAMKKHRSVLLLVGKALGARDHENNGDSGNRSKLYHPMYKHLFRPKFAAQVLVLGGTTQGKQAATALDEAEVPYLYSTKTPTDFTPGPWGVYRHGALDCDALIALIQQYAVTTILHAAHPFAQLLTQTLQQAQSQTDIAVHHYPRAMEKRIRHALVHYVANYAAAIRCLEALHVQRLLALTGVQSIAPLKPFWQHTTTYCRIWDKAASKDMALQAQFPVEQLLCANLTDLPAVEQLIATTRCDALLTKESGKEGLLSLKIAAAMQHNLPIVVLEKPAIPRSFQQINDMTTFIEQMKAHAPATT